MPNHGVVRRDRKSHSNLRPKHKHTKNYLKHYWPYLPLVSLILVGLWLVRPPVLRSQPQSVLAVATKVTNQGLLEATNKERAENNKPPVRINPQLSAAADAKAQDMVTRNYWSHNTPDGSPPWTFVINNGYQYQKAGENLAYGFSTDNDTVGGWMNSPTHKANLLDPDFVDVGFGTATSTDFNHNGPSTVVVAMYGRSTSETPIISVAGQSSEPGSYNSTQKSDPTPQTVSKADLLSSGNIGWLTSALSFLMGAALTLLLIKHTVAVKKALRKGEKFVVTHPLLDVLLVGIIIAGLIVTGQAGVIL